MGAATRRPQRIKQGGPIRRFWCVQEMSMSALPTLRESPVPGPRDTHCPPLRAGGHWRACSPASRKERHHLPRCSMVRVVPQRIYTQKASTSIHPRLCLPMARDGHVGLIRLPLVTGELCSNRIQRRRLVTNPLRRIDRAIPVHIRNEKGESPCKSAERSHMPVPPPP
jgi:hypothetical protein